MVYYFMQAKYRNKQLLDASHCFRDACSPFSHYSISQSAMETFGRVFESPKSHTPEKGFHDPLDGPAYWIDVQIF